MLFVNDIMTSDVKTVEDNSSIRDAAVLMTKSKIGSLVVTTRGKPVGIMTEGDVSRAVARGLDVERSKVKSVMSHPLITTKREVRLEEAAKAMAESNVKKLPVVEDGRLVGIVTQTDIVGASFGLVWSLKEMVRTRYRPPGFEP